MKFKIIVVILILQLIIIIVFGIRSVQTTTLLQDTFQQQDIVVELRERYFYNSLHLSVKSQLYEDDFSFDVETYENLSCQSHWLGDSHMLISILSENVKLEEYVLDFTGFFQRVKLISYQDYQDKSKENLIEKEPEESSPVEEYVPDVEVNTTLSKQPSVYFKHTISKYQDIQEVQYEIPSKDTDNRLQDENTYRNAKQKEIDLQINAGEVQITKDAGHTWQDVPINGGRLIDYWLSELRIGDESFYYHDDVIMVAYRINYYMPHLIVSYDNGKTWTDICFDMADQNGFQKLNITYKNNMYIISLDHQETCYSYDGLNWKFYK